jgi:hypothetical protein
MRRQLAALAALIVIVLGTPAIALASTLATGSGPPAQARLVCPPRPAIARATGFMVLTPRPVR